MPALDRARVSATRSPSQMRSVHCRAVHRTPRARGRSSSRNTGARRPNPCAAPRRHCCIEPARRPIDSRGTPDGRFAQPGIGRLVRFAHTIRLVGVSVVRERNSAMLSDQALTAGLSCRTGRRARRVPSGAGSEGARPCVARSVWLERWFVAYPLLGAGCCRDFYCLDGLVSARSAK